MSKRILMILVVAGLIVGLATPCTAATYWPVNGHWYALTQNYGDWDTCKAEAEAVGGYLAVINDEAENTFLTDFIKDAGLRGSPGPFTEPSDKNLAWIGYSELSPDVWNWYTGDPVTYTNYYELWDNYSGTHAYLHGGNHPAPGTWNHANWHDDDPSQQPFGVIEIVPEPATLSLLALGGLALIRRRKN